MRFLAKFIYFKILGWKIVGNTTFSKETIKKAVIIVAPHTSWHDFYMGLLVRKIAGLKTNFIGKKELFIWPFGCYFRALGGRPVDRNSGQNNVSNIAKLFQNEDEFRLALAPEGTRKKVANWRTGFYYIAKEAKVPIIMATMDFKNKQNKISEPFYTTNYPEKDFEYIKNYFNRVEGKIKQYS